MSKISIVNRKFRNVTPRCRTAILFSLPSHYRENVILSIWLYRYARVYLRRNVLFRGKIFFTHHRRITHTMIIAFHGSVTSNSFHIFIVISIEVGTYLYGLSCFSGCLLLFNIEGKEFFKMRI